MSNANKIELTSISALTDRLACVFDKLESGELECKVAAELNNTAGKMINAVKLQLEYEQVTKRNKDIKMLT